MPRISRIIAVDYPHHITLRGFRSMDIFHSDHDRNQYLQFIKTMWKDRRGQDAPQVILILLIRLKSWQVVCYRSKNPDLRKNNKA